MAKFLSYKPNDRIEITGILREVFERIRNLDRFTKVTFVIFLLIILITPFFINNRQAVIIKAEPLPESVTVESIGSGKWSNPFIWSTGEVPDIADHVGISSNNTITFDLEESDYTISGLTIAENGKLEFDPGKTLTLQTNKNILVRGELEMKPLNASLHHTIRFINVDELKFVGGGMDPIETDIGLWVRGKGLLDIAGTSKTSWTRLEGSADANATNIILQSVPLGWSIGDEISIVPTENPSVGSASWNGFDVRTITAISGNTVTLNSGLTRAHPAATDPNSGKTFTAEVLNLTRNVHIEGTGDGSADPAKNGRAHISITSSVPQFVSYAELKLLGPRKYGTKDPTEGVLGRYSLHFHHSMDGSRGSLIEGVVARNSGNTVFVPHASHGITFRDTIAYDNWGTGYWWDPPAGRPDPGWQTPTINNSNDTLYDRAVIAILKADPPFRGYRLQGFSLQAGDRNEVRNSVAVGIQGNNDANGFTWPEIPNGTDGVWIFNTENISHNNKADGIFTWQNNSNSHVIQNAVVYHNGDNGVEHGAYHNNYQYIDVIAFGNGSNGFMMHSNSNGGANIRSDGYGQTLERYSSMGSLEFVPHQLGGPVPTLIKDCVFTKVIVNDVKSTSGKLDTSLKTTWADFVNCKNTNGSSLEPEDFELTSVFQDPAQGKNFEIRVQRSDDTAYKINVAGSTVTGTLDKTKIVTSIPPFYTVQTPSPTPIPPSDQPEITSFDINPEFVAPGESTTLSWVSTNATSCSGAFTLDDGSTQVLDIGARTSGSLTVTPTETTTYNLNCSNGDSFDDETLTITVSLPPPTASITATPTNIVSGGSTTLFWNSSNAVQCSGTNFSTEGAITGSISVSPIVPTTYIVKCIQPGIDSTAETLEAIASVTVSIDGVITIEAESMSLSGYEIDTTNREIIWVDKELTGTATTTFVGESGDYNVLINVIAENDGTPILEFLVNSELEGSFIYPLGTISRDLMQLKVENSVNINNGDEIALKGTKAFGSGTAHARVDNIVLVKTSESIPTATPTPTRVPTNVPTATPINTPKPTQTPKGNKAVNHVIFNSQGFDLYTTGQLSKYVHSQDSFMLFSGNNTGSINATQLNSWASELKSLYPGIEIYAATSGINNINLGSPLLDKNLFNGFIYVYEPNQPNAPEFSWEMSTTETIWEEVKTTISSNGLIPWGKPSGRALEDRDKAGSWNYGVLGNIMDGMNVQTQGSCSNNTMSIAIDDLVGQYRSAGTNSILFAQVTVASNQVNHAPPEQAINCSELAWAVPEIKRVTLWYAPSLVSEVEAYLEIRENLLSPLPTPVPTPVPCSIVSASWGQSTALNGEQITLFITGNNPSCNGKSISFIVRENDSIIEGGIDESVSKNPISTVFVNTAASTIWNAEWIEDGFLGVFNPPEYFFKASLSEDPSREIRSSDPLLIVSKPESPTPTPTPTEVPTPTIDPNKLSIIESSIDVEEASDSAKITWETNLESISLVKFGLKGSRIRPQGPLATIHTNTITGLEPCTRYAFKVEARRGNDVVQSEGRFLTLGCEATVIDDITTDSPLVASVGGSLALLKDITNPSSHGLTLLIPPLFRSIESSFQILKFEIQEYIDNIGRPEGFVAVGGHIYKLQSFEGEEEGKISSFDTSLTVKIKYSDEDIQNIIEDTLTIQKWDGTKWNALTNCVLNKTAKEVTCETDSFSDFMLVGEEVENPVPTSTPTQTPSSGSSGGNSSSGSSSSGGSSSGGSSGGSSSPSTSSDLNSDGKTNIFDLSIMLRNWNKSGQGDLNSDGKVNIFDLSILLRNWKS